MPIVRESMAVRHRTAANGMTTTMGVAEQTNGYILFPTGAGSPQRAMHEEYVPVSNTSNMDIALPEIPMAPLPMIADVPYQSPRALQYQLNSTAAIHSRPTSVSPRYTYSPSGVDLSGLGNAGSQSMTIATSNMPLGPLETHEVVRTVLASPAGSRGGSPTYHSVNTAVRASCAPGVASPGLHTSAVADATYAGSSPPRHLGTRTAASYGAF